MGTIDTLLRVKADASQAVRGLRPLQASLEETAKDAKVTDKALDALDGTHNIRLNDAAVANARKEIDRLRATMRNELSVDVNADTREAQRRIAQLQRSVKSLDSEKIDVPVVVDTQDLAAAQSGVSGIANSVKGLAAIVGGAEVGRWLLDGATGASAFETNMRAVEAVLDDVTRSELEDWITTNADGLNLSEVSASELARTLSLTASKFADAGGDAGDFLIKLEEITAEAAAFSGANAGEVALAIGAAFRGEFDSLETFGINLTADLVAAQALKDGLVGIGEELTPAIKVQATYNAILEQSGPLMGSTARNADTLGGKLADLRQSAQDLGTTIGETLGPTLEGLADVALIATDAIGTAASEWNKLRGTINESADDDVNRFDDFIDFVTGSLPEMGRKWNEMRKNAFDSGWQEREGNSVLVLDGILGNFLPTMEAVTDAGTEATDVAVDQAEAMSDLASRVSDTQGKYEDLRDAFVAFNDAAIEGRSNVYDYQGAIDDLAESLADSATFAPDAEEGRTNWDNLVALAESASERVQDAFNNKGRGAAVALQASYRQSLQRMLVEAGVSSERAWALVDQVMKKPHQIDVELSAVGEARLRAQLARLRKRRFTIEAQVDADTGTTRAIDDAAIELQRKLKPLDAKITATLEDLHPEQEKLDDTANPGGKARKAKIDPTVDQASAAAAKASLDALALPRTVLLRVQYSIPGVPPGLVLPGAQLAPSSLIGAGPAMLAAPTPTATGGSWTPTLGGPTTTAGGPQTVRLAPRQTPVAVYLDGVEIAHRIEARRAAASTTSVRRTA